jgi:ComF family protein
MSFIDVGAKLARNSLGSVLDLLFPPVCPICEVSLEDENREKNRFICASCISSIQRIEDPICYYCGDPLDEDDLDICNQCAVEDVPFQQARSYGIYDGTLARSIQQLKYEREQALAHDLAPLLEELVLRKDLQHKIDGITYVPMHKSNQRLRGFNQSELLARRLGKLINKPVMTTLRKTKSTRSQMELSGSDRRENLSGVFEALPHVNSGIMLLIDDVYTTGTTISECSKVLRQHGIEEVVVLTLARAPLSNRVDENEY